MSTGARGFSTHTGDVLLRRTAIVLLVALVVHGADHAARGLDVVTSVVLTAGTIQLLVAALAARLVFTDHPAAPQLAVLIGFAGALGFASAHLLPQWSSLSDPFVGAQVAPGVTGLSWFTAVFEIAADLTFGWAGIRALQLRGHQPVDA